MCGICGFVGFHDDDLLRRMCSVLTHRGPDDEGVFVDQEASLGVRRLSIIDVAGGHQPLSNEDRSLWVVFNGEIYNYRELREILVNRGHRFYTETDTEVIVHLYEERGEECVRSLRGMFAFALWDKNKNKLLLARDRVGIKPLYYLVHNEKLLFASEIKSLLEYGGYSREVDPDALVSYLTFLYVPSPHSIFKGIKKLLPGHILVYQNRSVTLRQYWDLVFPEKRRDSPHYYRERAGQLLEESVKLHLVGDVPVGVFLSGGVDSSSIVALMRKCGADPIKTFSLGFDGEGGSYSEDEYARGVADHFGTEHHEFYVAPDAVDLLPRLVWHLDEPCADSSLILTFLISQAAREHVTVALSGIGGDEVFGGYPRYLGVKLARAYELFPLILRRDFLARLIDLLPESSESRNLPGWIKRFVKGGCLPERDRYVSWISFFTDQELHSLLSGAFQEKVRMEEIGNSHRRLYEKCQTHDDLNRVFSLDLQTYLVDDLLLMADKMSMAASLELRVPYCDHRLVEFMATVPSSVRIQGFRLKSLLKETMKGRVPDSVLTRKKQGFMIPLAAWLRGALAESVQDLLSEDRVRRRGYFRPEYIRWIRDQHQSLRRNMADQIFALMTLELWHQICIDRTYGESPSPIPRQEKIAFCSSRKRLRILCVSDASPVTVLGGSQRVLREYAVRLAQRGHEVHVLSRAETGSLSQASPDPLPPTVSLHEIPVPSRFPLVYLLSSFWRFMRAYHRLCRPRKFDIINFHQPISSVSVLCSLKSWRIPHIYTFLSPSSEEYKTRQIPPGKRNGFMVTVHSALRLFIERLCLACCRKILVLSDFSRDQLKRGHHISESKIVKIPGGVDPDLFTPVGDRSSLKEELGVPRHLFLLFTVRNLVPRMGLDNLIRAMKRVVSERKDVLLIIGGEGPLEKMLKALSFRLGLDSHIRFEGFIPEKNLPHYYQAADLFLLPTQFLEGFGLVTVEALACGTPVLGTPVGATREILSSLDPDLLFTGVTPREMAGKILDYLARTDLTDLRRRCRDFAASRYSWDRVVSEVEREFFAMLDKEKKRL